VPALDEVSCTAHLFAAAAVGCGAVAVFAAPTSWASDAVALDRSLPRLGFGDDVDPQRVPSVVGVQGAI
jgi:hypothetical protein